jgi:hypothetical protein
MCFICNLENRKIFKCCKSHALFIFLPVSFDEIILFFCNSAVILDFVGYVPYIANWFGLVWFIMFRATFNNSSAISWRSVLLVEERNHRPVASH